MQGGIVGRRVSFDHNGEQDEGEVLAFWCAGEGFFLLIMTADGDLTTCKAGATGDGKERGKNAVVIADLAPELDDVRVPDPALFKLDENGGYMKRVRIGGRFEAWGYMHLLPIETIDGTQHPKKGTEKNPYWEDFNRVTEGLDGPLQTVKHNGDDCFFFIIPCPI